MNSRPLLVLAALAAATSPDMGKSALDRFKGGVRDGFARDPMGTVLATVLGGAWLFYKAERGHNPKVKSFYDALVYVSTNLSVGYSDIFAKTTRGKAIGSALMTYGPAMAARIFDTPSATPTSPLHVVREAAAANATASAHADRAPAVTVAVAEKPGAASSDVLERLDRILAILEANREQVALPKKA
jgi:voltage-gated potassium channel